MDWEPWPDFVREQIDAIGQMQESIARWNAARQAAMMRGEYKEAARLERLISIYTQDLGDKTMAVKNLMKGREVL